MDYIKSIEINNSNLITTDDLEYGKIMWRRDASGMIWSSPLDENGNPKIWERTTRHETTYGDAAMELENDLYDLVLSVFEKITTTSH